MQSKKIEEAEVISLKVSSLPTRPTAKEAFGGKGYSASEMKAAFDKLPEYILEKLNLLIEDLLREGEDSYVGSFKTGISENYSLQNLIDGIMNGELASIVSGGTRGMFDEAERSLISEELVRANNFIVDLYAKKGWTLTERRLAVRNNGAYYLEANLSIPEEQCSSGQKSYGVYINIK